MLAAAEHGVAVTGAEGLLELPYWTGRGDHRTGHASS